MYDDKASRHQAFYRGLGGLGAALAQAGAPSTTPRGLLAPIAAGGQGFLSGMSGYRNEMAGQQAQAMQRGQFDMQKRESEARLRDVEQRTQARARLMAMFGGGSMAGSPNQPGLPVDPAKLSADPAFRMTAADAGYRPEDIFPDQKAGRETFQTVQGASAQQFNLPTDGTVFQVGSNGTVREVWSPPKKDKAPELPSSVREIEYWTAQLDRLPENSPSRGVILARLAKLTKDGPLVQVNTGDAPGRAMNPDVHAEYKGLRGTVNDYNDSILSLNAIESLVESVPSNMQGAGAEKFLEFRKWAQKLGFDAEGVTDVAQAEALRSKAIAMALEMVKKTKGSVSNSEMELFMSGVVSLGNSAVGNAMIVKYAKRAAERSGKIASQMMEWVQQNPMVTLFDYDRKYAEVENVVKQEHFIDDQDMPFFKARTGGAAAPPPPPGFGPIGSDTQ